MVSIFFFNCGDFCFSCSLYTIPNLMPHCSLKGPSTFPRHLLFNLVTSWKIIILPTFEPENAELIILFLGSTFVYLNGVRTSHCDSMSISRSIVGSLPLAFALHYHSNDFLTLLSKVEIYISSCGDKWHTQKPFVVCNNLFSTGCYV